MCGWQGGLGDGGDHAGVWMGMDGVRKMRGCVRAAGGRAVGLFLSIFSSSFSTHPLSLSLSPFLPPSGGATNLFNPLPLFAQHKAWCVSCVEREKAGRMRGG
jgi:hypothetical protein